MSLLTLLISARNAITEWRRREKAYGELMALDDRSLADIGIRRSEIRALVEGTHALERSPAPRPGRSARQRPTEHVPLAF